MKKLLLALLFSVFLASTAHAACVCTDAGLQGLGQAGKVRVVWTCTADTTPGTCTDAVEDSTMQAIGGRYLYTITTYPGGTAPTDATDLAITDSISKSYLSATGNGANLIDATSTLWNFADGGVGAENMYPLIHADRALTFTVTNQAVNNAVFYIEFELID